MTSIFYVKMASVGNKILVLPFIKNVNNSLIKILCAHLQVDQVMVLKEPMDIWNYDGSQALACGNGTRCVAAYLGRTPHVLQGPVGPLAVWKEECDSWSVEQGVVTLSAEQLDLKAYGLKEKGWKGEIGNDHLVVVTPDLFLFAKHAPILSKHPDFPNGVNVSFCHPHTHETLVWERGVGPTLGCGSAACVIGAVLAQQTENAVKKSFDSSKKGPFFLSMPGGRITVEAILNRWHHKASVDFIAQGWIKI